MKQVFMLGTRFDTMGGISAVVQVYQDQGLFQRQPLRYLATHRDGSALQKLLCMLQAWCALVWALLWRRVLLLHLHVASGPSFWRKSIFIASAMLFGVPYLFHLHGAGFAQFYAGAKPWQQRWIRHVLARAARVVVLSDSWQAWAHSVCPQATVSTLYNPVNLPAAPASKAAGDGLIRLLFLGRLGERKGVPDLLQAMAQLAPQFANLRLILAGDGAVEAARAQAQQLGLADRVAFPGWIDASAKARYLAQADIYVLPSYAEGLPMSVLEAMSYGLPIVSTTVGGIPEAVSHGVEGYLIEPGALPELVHSLQSLLAQPAHMVQMGQQARDKVARCFASHIVVPQLEQIYQQLGVPARS